MPELLRLQTSEFELSIWSNDVSKRFQVLQSTLGKRGMMQGSQNGHNHSPTVRFSPAIVLADLVCSGTPASLFDSTPTTKVELKNPLFFENTQYQFEWIFYNNVSHAQVTHRSQLVNEGFRFAEKRCDVPARLTGTINTGNDVGWMRLPLEYISDGRPTLLDISFEVLPTKMDLRQDLPAMYQSIDSTFPLWRFSLSEKTAQDTAKGLKRGQFPLMWLANFGQLRERFERGLKVISQAPHSRLQPHVVFAKTSRLKGNLPHRLSAKVKEDLANGLRDKRYRVEKKKLNVDTPENRFIKMAATNCKKQLAHFENHLRNSNMAPDKQRLSNAFLDELHAWQQPLQKALGQSFMKNVGKFSSLNRESLVLQQKTGYNAVYRVWQELKFYLDVFGNQASISMKSIAEIYEVWCFLTLRKILLTELGFEEVSTAKGTLTLNEFFEYRLKDGFAGSFKFKRADGVEARLAHEPIFTKQGRSIRSYLVNQTPDIVLEVTMPAPSRKKFIWLFDAKYRIKAEKSGEGEEDTDTVDYVPDDAINQMHRYRDALIRINQNDIEPESRSSSQQKSRPIFGAFALYPGFFDQENTVNPYFQAINEIGIGAFALLPSSLNSDEPKGRATRSTNGHAWLVAFLKDQIGSNQSKGNPYDVKTLEERLYVQEAARIAYYGMEQVLYPDLTMTIALTGQKNRNSDYFAAFEEGTAEWYHLPQKTFSQKYKQHVAEEIRYLALASTAEHDPRIKQIHKLWPVKHVTIVPRYAITEQQAGKTSKSDEPYYLFELGRPLSLLAPVTHVPHRPIRNSMKLTTLSRLESARLFNEIEKVYPEVLV